LSSFISQVLLALVRAESSEFVHAYLAEITEVAVRGTLAVNTTPDATTSLVQTAKELSAELLEVLEQIVGSAAFIGAYSEAQRRVQGSKAEKKRQLAAEAITAPQKYAARKVREGYGFVSLCLTLCSLRFFCVILLQIERSQKKQQAKKRQTLKNAAIHGLRRKTGKSSAAY
jgi:hypothetical protein